MSDEWDPEDTDPDVFAEPAVPAGLEPEEGAVTKRRCQGCGLELPPCDCGKQIREVVTMLLERFIEHVVRGGMPRGEAARWANDLAREFGIHLL